MTYTPKVGDRVRVTIAAATVVKCGVGCDDTHVETEAGHIRIPADAISVTMDCLSGEPVQP